MKKITVILFLTFGYISSVFATGVNVGVSLTAGQFEAKEITETFQGAHMGGTSPGTVTKKTDGEDQAEGEFALGSIFIEAQINDMFALGVDYVPHDIESKRTTNEHNIANNVSAVDLHNKVQITFENLATVYGTVQIPVLPGLYAKAGYVMVDLNTNEDLETGGSYGNTDLTGYSFGLGYNHDFGPAFVRLETHYMELDGTTLTNQVDTTKSITSDGITGYGARVSIGKAF